ncbi:hypothetical protein J6590_016951 [Homalodisca vitripennis]|nr:hypothetical protein J6590_016951 [Homalodisca vitripennis]
MVLPYRCRALTMLCGLLILVPSSASVHRRIVQDKEMHVQHSTFKLEDSIRKFIRSKTDCNGTTVKRLLDLKFYLPTLLVRTSRWGSSRSRALNIA